MCVLLHFCRKMRHRFPSALVQAFLIIMTGLAFSSCGSSERHAPEMIDKEAFIALGDSLSLLAQKTLLQNVSGAIAKGGAAHAVAFCNSRAMPLTDSLGDKNAVTIQRVTDKARNSANALSGEHEIALFQKIQDSLQNGNVQPHYLIEDVNGRTLPKSKRNIPMTPQRVIRWGSCGVCGRLRLCRERGEIIVDLFFYCK